MGGGGVTSLRGQNGEQIDLTDSPLVYGSKDKTLSAAARKAVEAQEAKRTPYKTEYALAFDENGNPLGAERHGGTGSVNVPVSWEMTPRATLTHNHPRGKNEEGLIGGTFSPADLNSFSKGRYTTMRASANEGTYSISKTLNFDRDGFTKYQSSLASAANSAHKSRSAKLMQDAVAGKITVKKYVSENAKSFNKMLVDIHNGLIQGQSQYGYKYTLEGNNG